MWTQWEILWVEGLTELEFFTNKMSDWRKELIPFRKCKDKRGMWEIVYGTIEIVYWNYSVRRSNLRIVSKTKDYLSRLDIIWHHRRSIRNKVESYWWLFLEIIYFRGEITRVRELARN